MRAGKFRGSRTRSPSWPNELNEKVIRQKPGSAGLFSFGNAPCTTRNGRRKPLRAIILLAYVRRRTYEVQDGRDENDAAGLITQASQITTPVARVHREAREGYPVPTSKKKRACIVTYRHSGEVLFENSLSPYFNFNNL
jgi:hypothetical protein